jgi:hypothetical protein
MLGGRKSFPYSRYSSKGNPFGSMYKKNLFELRDKKPGMPVATVSC